MSSFHKKRVLKSLKIKDKINIIKEIDTGVKRIDISRKYGVPPSTITGIYKNRLKVCDSVVSLNNTNMKRNKKCKFDKLNDAVLLFVKQVKSINLPLSGDMVKEKAMIFASKFGVNNFKASNGWLTKFKNRHNISLKKMCGESADVKDSDVEDWKINLKILIRDYDPKNIFNADETGLFYKCMPDKTLTFKNEKCHGGKHSKQRITVFLCTNMDGSEKLEPLVIGKSRKPRCFKNVRSLPLNYTFNKKSWMTGNIFENWLKNVDNKFASENRKILLFIDNCPAHPKGAVEHLRAVTVLYFPPNMTSKSQPLDLGIIKNFKHYYRKDIVRRQLSDLENNVPLSQINLLDAIYIISKTWNNDVKATTISNCFKKAGFLSEWCEEDDIPLSELRQMMPVVSETIAEETETPSAWDKLQNLLGFSETFEDFVTFDDDVITTQVFDDEEIIESVSIEMQPDEISVEENNDDISTNTSEKVEESLKVIFNKLTSKEEVPPSIWHAFYAIEKCLKHN